ncbi:MAG: hypothetical protein V4539_24410 [Bacteroidota bacterium]
MNNTNTFPTIFFLSTLLSCADMDAKGQNIESFEIEILNSYFAEAYTVSTILTDKQLKIVFKSGIAGTKDRTVFAEALTFSDTLRQIGEMDLTKLKAYYSNPCINDGSQITITLNKDGKTKSIHLSNYYHGAIGKIIYLSNSLVPEKYKVWYDKKILIDEYKACGELTNRKS